MSLDDLEKIAGAIQSIVTVVAIVAGGIWARYTFGALSTVRKARAEVAELELRILEYPVLTITLDWQVWRQADGQSYCMAVTAYFKNEGKRALRFKDVEATLLRKADSTDAGSVARSVTAKPEYVPMTGGQPEAMPPRFLRSGQGRNVGMLFREVECGDYLLQVDATYLGVLLKDGKFEASADQVVKAFEQAIAHIPPETAITGPTNRNEGGAKQGHS